MAVHLGYLVVLYFLSVLPLCSYGEGNTKRTQLSVPTSLRTSTTEDTINLTSPTSRSSMSDTTSNDANEILVISLIGTIAAITVLCTCALVCMYHWRRQTGKGKISRSTSSMKLEIVHRVEDQFDKSSPQNIDTNTTTLELDMNECGTFQNPLALAMSPMTPRLLSDMNSSPHGGTVAYHQENEYKNPLSRSLWDTRRMSRSLDNLFNLHPLGGPRGLSFNCCLSHEDIRINFKREPSNFNTTRSTASDKGYFSNPNKAKMLHKGEYRPTCDAETLSRSKNWDEVDAVNQTYEVMTGSLSSGTNQSYGQPGYSYSLPRLEAKGGGIKTLYSLPTWGKRPPELSTPKAKAVNNVYVNREVDSTMPKEKPQVGRPPLQPVLSNPPSPRASFKKDASLSNRPLPAIPRRTDGAVRKTSLDLTTGGYLKEKGLDHTRATLPRRVRFQDEV